MGFQKWDFKKGISKTRFIYRVQIVLTTDRRPVGAAPFCTRSAGS